jgi:hypothetical protein
MNKIFAPFLPPWVETGLQPAFYDMESGTVLQQTARMYAKVQQLTRLFNELSKETRETVEAYIAKFIELKDFVDDYFDNLDIQEEVNNKLDEMTESGELQTLILNYAGLQKIYSTIDEMKDDSSLSNGQKVKCFGEHQIGDGRGGEFIIGDSGDIALDNGKYASYLNDYSDNYYNFEYSVERYYNTDCYFITIPLNDNNGNLIMPYVGQQDDASQTPNDYAVANNTSLTINASLTIKAPEGSGLSNAIPSIISNGEIIRTHDDFVNTALADNYMYLGIKADRSLSEYKVNSTTSNQLLADGCVQAFDVYYKLIHNYVPCDLSGVVTNESGVVTNPNPRQVIAEMQDGTIMILTCDGRTDYDTGLTSAQMQNILVEKGVKNAWNLDGGGSTSTSVNGFKVNKDIDNDGTGDRNIPYTLNCRLIPVDKSRADELGFIAKVIDSKIDKVVNEAVKTTAISGEDINEQTAKLLFGYGNNLTNSPVADAGGYLVNLTNPIANNRETFNAQFFKPRFRDEVWMRTMAGEGWRAWHRIYPYAIEEISCNVTALSADDTYENIAFGTVSYDSNVVEVSNDNTYFDFPNSFGEVHLIKFDAEFYCTTAGTKYFKILRNNTAIATHRVGCATGWNEINVECLSTASSTDKFYIQYYGKTGERMERAKVIVI